MIKAITPEEFAEVSANYQPISDLKVGDNVRYKAQPGMVATRFPQIGEIVVVFSTDIPANTEQHDVGCQLRRSDFTALCRGDDGELLEYALCSRRFERVED